MIIGETFNERTHYGRGDDRYDYLFRRRTKEERKQHRQEKKQARQERREEKRQPSGSEGKHRLPLFGNFGLFDRNKNKKSTNTTSSIAKKESGASAETSAIEEAKKNTAEPAMQDRSEGGNSSENESAIQETSKLESKELDPNTKPKEAGFGPLLGFAFLGITILIAGIAIYKADKKPISELQPLRAAA